MKLLAIRIRYYETNLDYNDSDGASRTDISERQ